MFRVEYTLSRMRAAVVLFLGFGLVPRFRMGTQLHTRLCLAEGRRQSLQDSVFLGRASEQGGR